MYFSILYKYVRYTEAYVVRVYSKLFGYCYRYKKHKEKIRLGGRDEASIMKKLSGFEGVCKLFGVVGSRPRAERPDWG